MIPPDSLDLRFNVHWCSIVGFLYDSNIQYWTHCCRCWLAMSRVSSRKDFSTQGTHFIKDKEKEKILTLKATLDESNTDAVGSLVPNLLS